MPELGPLESQLVKVASEKSPCPYCGDPGEQGGKPPEVCPFHSQPRCPLLGSEVDGELAVRDELALRMDETVAYLPARDSDGFPEIDDLTGTDLGQYQIIEVIGQGSMGRVYRGIHRGLGRTSAIKVLSPGLVQRQPKMVERFWSEARAVASLVHPNIVTVHNLGSDRGYHYIEMEYIPGGISLKESIVHEGALDPLRATDLIRQVAQALEVAHRSGLVHHDIKPANILLTPEGQAKLADFGLVRKLTEVATCGTPLAGTPAFMAPELFSGEPASPRTDLYALGVSLFYLLTARLPFASERVVQLIHMHRHAELPDPRRIAPETPDSLVRILERLLAKSPSERFATAEDLAEELGIITTHLRDTESLIREALDGINCLVQQGARDAFRAIVPVPGDRLQEVYIEVVEGRHRERLLSVFSVCAPADPSHYEFALKLNARLSYGSLSIRLVNGAPMFVMTSNHNRAHVTAADIRASVVEIARRGDWVEQQLTSIDLF